MENGRFFIDFCRMLVAAYVGASSTGPRLNLMQTTLMPNLAALPMLCCLLFSPMVELRCNPKFTRYSGAVCGLGYDRKTKTSFYPANDLEVVFDHEISDSELELINKTRYWLNVAVNPGKSGNEYLVQCRSKLNEYLKMYVFASYDDFPTHYRK
jgi:ATP-dependent RNA helicase TDRD9